MVLIMFAGVSSIGLVLGCLQTFASEQHVSTTLFCSLGRATLRIGVCASGAVASIQGTRSTEVRCVTYHWKESDDMDEREGFLSVVPVLGSRRCFFLTSWKMWFQFLKVFWFHDQTRRESGGFLDYTMSSVSECPFLRDHLHATAKALGKSPGSSTLSTRDSGSVDDHWIINTTTVAPITPSRNVCYVWRNTYTQFHKRQHHQHAHTHTINTHMTHYTHNSTQSHYIT